MTTLAAIKERPILFSAPMVRAILEGRKTETRRIIKAPSWSDGIENIEIDCDGEPLFICKTTGCQSVLECPYGNVGDRLWVRETFRFTEDIDGREVLEFRAGGTRLITRNRDGLPSAVHGEHRATSILPPWKPSIFMPRWASRIALEITGRRCERVQALTAYCAAAEGIPIHVAELTFRKVYRDAEERAEQRIDCFAKLWEKINGPDSWSDNPWVRVIVFKLITPET